MRLAAPGLRATKAGGAASQYGNTALRQEGGQEQTGLHTKCKGMAAVAHNTSQVKGAIHDDAGHPSMGKNGLRHTCALNRGSCHAGHLATLGSTATTRVGAPPAVLIGKPPTLGRAGFADVGA